MPKAVKSVSIARIFVQQFRRRAALQRTPPACRLFPVFSFAKPCEQTVEDKKSLMSTPLHMFRISYKPYFLLVCFTAHMLCRNYDVPTQIRVCSVLFSCGAKTMSPFSSADEGR